MAGGQWLGGWWLVGDWWLQSPIPSHTHTQSTNTERTHLFRTRATGYGVQSFWKKWRVTPKSFKTSWWKNIPGEAGDKYRKKKTNGCDKYFQNSEFFLNFSFKDCMFADIYFFPPNFAETLNLATMFRVIYTDQPRVIYIDQPQSCFFSKTQVCKDQSSEILQKLRILKRFCVKVTKPWQAT